MESREGRPGLGESTEIEVSWVPAGSTEFKFIHLDGELYKLRGDKGGGYRVEATGQAAFQRLRNDILDGKVRGEKVQETFITIALELWHRVWLIAKPALIAMVLAALAYITQLITGIDTQIR